MNDHDETASSNESDAPVTPSPADPLGEPTAGGLAAPGWPPPTGPNRLDEAAWRPPVPGATTAPGPDPWVDGRYRGPGVPPAAPWMASDPAAQQPQPGQHPGAYGQAPYGAAGATSPGPHGPDEPQGYTAPQGYFAPQGYGPAAGGAGIPPYGSSAGWVPPPPGEPWGPPPNRATRRRRARKAVASGVIVGVLGAGAAGVLIGHTAWQSGSSNRSAAASLPAGTGSGSTGSGSTGSGSTGSGSAGSGSTGSGSGSTGSGTGGSGSSSPFGSFGSSGSASSSTSAGAPSDAAAIVKKVQAGLVDINTTLGYAQESAAGTGMVLTSNGEILTNNHVIDGATSIRVTDIGNGRTYAATVVGYDRRQDVAVLQLAKASGLTTVTLGDSAQVTKAQGVVGIGNAGGVGGTPSYAGGSVVALGQSITASDQGGGNAEKLVGLIETNAAIQAGDSGGSLVDSSGRVIGMDTAASSAAQFQAATSSTSYAIPINQAVGIARQIVDGRGSSVIHIGTTALLGVEVEPSGTGSAFGVPSGAITSGALIAGVVSGSPADRAGLVAGDTITGVSGRTVASAEALTAALGGNRPGDTVAIVYVDQSGQRHTVTVHLTAGPPQ